MTIDELLQHLAEQPEIKQTRQVRVWGAQLRAEIEARRLSRLDEIFAHPDQTTELRTFRYGHVVGPGLRTDKVAEWQSRHPAHPLPRDLVELATKANGIHIWADLDAGRAYYGLLPLEQWEDATAVGWAALFDSPPVGELVISYHQNGDYYLVLNTANSEYRWYDTEDMGNPRVVGSSLAEVLDWYWSEAQKLDPRK